jgi:bloom syndrome protein
LQEIATFVQNTYPRESGIIYCLSKKECENVAEKLRSKHKLSATHYHADIPAEERRLTQVRERQTLRCVVERKL